MCNGLSHEENERYKKLGEYAARVLRGESLKDIAIAEEKTLEEVETEFRAIKTSIRICTDRFLVRIDL